MHFEARKALESDEQPISEMVITIFGDTQGRAIAELIDDLPVDSRVKPSL